MDPVITSFWAKPMPIRNHDWCAYRDPEGRCGYGETEQEAVADLLEQEEEAA